ncbi:MAG: phospho-sugar mutase [Erysipelotrichaceae bacterium]|nr:phospho-sugar mutase [Erysipelotrichaceae bacterium]
MIEEKYRQWLEEPSMDPELKAELETMTEEQKHDAFYTDAEFGTAGMRGLLGAGTNRLNVYTIRKATVGLARYLLATTEGQPSVAISYDNRFNSTLFAEESAKVLASYGIKSYIFESLRSTPELSYAVRYLNCTSGIMITASHNPKEYNGYKVYDSTGCQMVPDMVAGVIDEIKKVEETFVLSPELNEEQKQLIHTIGKDVDDPYIADVLKIQLNPDLDKNNFRLVFTPQHGTAYETVKELYRQIGYDCVYVKEQCTPDPAFSNTIIPNPEDPRAYELAIKYAEACKADIAISTDPDDDRLGVVVRQDGKYVLMTGNQTGAVLLEYVYSQLKEKGLMPARPVMFNTVVTGDLGEKVADSYGVETEKTLTGFKYIGDKIHKYELSHEKNFVFGYEESYGYLVSPIVRDKDANQSSVLIAECANFYKKQGKTLLDVLHELYARFGTYDESQQSISLPGEEGKAQIKKMLNAIRENRPAAIAGCPVVKFEDFLLRKQYVEGEERELNGFDLSDVLKLTLADESWIAIRPSGTEPKCKIYYCIKGRDANDVAVKKEQYYAAMKKLTA